VSNSHLVFDGFAFVIGGLFNFAIAQSGEVSFHFGAQFISFFKEGAVSGDFCPDIVGNVQIFGTTVLFSFKETWVVDRTALRILLRNCFICFQRTSEFDSFSVAFFEFAVGFHFQVGLTQRQSFRSEGFFRLCVARVDRNNGLTFELLDNEIVQVFFIISRIGYEDSIFLKTVNSLELVDEFFGDFGIGLVVRQGEFNERDTFF